MPIPILPLCCSNSFAKTAASLILLQLQFIVVAVVLDKFGGIQDGCAFVLVAKLTEAH